VNLLAEETYIDGSGPVVVYQGRPYHYFLGCGYHCLQDRPELKKKLSVELATHPFKPGMSHYGYGFSNLHSRLEAQLGLFFASDSALTCGSGYLSNTIALRGATGEFDRIFMDQESHYSLRDAAVLSGKPVEYFTHRDACDFRHKLCEALRPGEVPLVASDGVFSITGAIAPLPAYVEVLEGLAQVNRYLLFIDDAHGAGVLGTRGQGTLDNFQLKGPSFRMTGTLSKAFGAHGGFVPCSQEQRNFMSKQSWVLRGSTEMPNASAVAALFGVEFLTAHPELILSLRNNALHFKTRLQNMGISISLEPSAIAFIQNSKELDVRALHAGLLARGIIANLVPDHAYAGVPEGGGIKFTIFSQHRREQLDYVLGCVEEFINQRK